MDLLFVPGIEHILVFRDVWSWQHESTIMLRCVERTSERQAGHMFLRPIIGVQVWV